MALFLEVFCFARSNCVIDRVDHVSVSYQVIYSRDKRRFFFYWVPLILYAGAIFALSSLSALPEMPKKSDKILHFLEYSFFAFLLWRALARDRLWTLESSRFLIVILVGSLYAATDEIHQSYVPGRYASISDWFADVAGILGMLTLMVIRLKWRGSGWQRYETI
jgi:VanZ family protein